ncbi:MAG: hypothetical protein M3Y79_08295 [Pseudomonadota bacterium]|nr:hypothetical protein [Pseudomonadota bacterium]
MIARYNGRNHLWLQPVGGGAAKPLPGTADAVHPFWSPDGSKLAYFGDDEMRQVDVRSGQVTTILTAVTFPAGGSWGKNGTILFATHGRYMIWSVPETGGTPAIVVALDGPDQYALVHPHFLPDGQNFLYYTQGKPHERGIYQGVLGSNFGRRLIETEAAGAYAAGKLYYVKDGTLYARAFDELLGALGEKAEVIATGVPMGGRSIAGFASNGRQVVYRKGSAGGARQLTWYDRAGKKVGTVGKPYDAANSAPSLSPDGKAVVVNHMVGGTGDIGIIDLATGSLTPVSDDPATDLSPLWSSDGKYILFSSKRTNTIEMYRQKIGAPMMAEKEFPAIGLRHAMDMTRDGRFLFYRMNTPDLWVQDRDTGKEISIIPAGASRVQWPQVSPDGRWIAFQSNVSGSTQVHLHGPFAPPSLGTTSKPLSVNGGGWVRWSGDGKELFYTEADGTLMSVGLKFAADGGSFTAAAPVRLFTAPMNASYENSGIAQQYSVAPDAKRFLVVAAPDEDSPVYLHTP